MRKILVTSGLPYANGPLHLGHLLEYVQTDIWVRWQKMSGNDCIYVCGEDAHGTPIMLSAKKANLSPEEFISTIKKQHERDFADFYINFDNFYTTHSEENQELAIDIYKKLQTNDDIEQKTIEQLYDPSAQMFLPDRFVKGTCPRCRAENQYGDSCEVCGATYSPTELINPISAISETQPIKKSSLHYFFKLEKYLETLKNWMSQALAPEIVNKLNEWFAVGLKPWDISRDAPYFGFKIPDTENKYFYVWLDAPIGYIASFKNLCSHKKLDFDAYWKDPDTTELYHFVGKDIIYFHALFWPSILTSAGLRKPTAIFTHGFLTVNGQKMSKSRGTFITARNYLDKLNPEYLRYYLAAKLNNRIDDLDFNLDDFVARVNSDLVGKVVNIASRCAGFINKNFNGQLAANCDEPKLFNAFSAAAEVIGNAYENREYSNAVRTIMSLADRANQYIDEKKPWALNKLDPTNPEILQICTVGLNCFRLLILYLKPILPKMAEETEHFLNIAPLTWDDRKTLLLAHKINSFKPLMLRVDLEKARELTICK